MSGGSRIRGFHTASVEERLGLLEASGLVSGAGLEHLARGGRVELGLVDRMSENVVATQCLPFAVGLNFRVNGRDVLVPMAVEEPSVVAAASHAAKMVRLSGGFTGDADPPVMTAQVQLDEVPEPEAAAAALVADKAALIAVANAAIPRMVARGGGCCDLEARVVDAALGLLVVHLYVDVGDAMGANIVDTVAEAVAPEVERRVGGQVGLRILSNLPLRRRVRVEARVSAHALDGADGEALADGVARASRFAERDPFRAVTHNKGIMNGVDAAAVALGQDWRAIEAGAHAYAALSGAYRPLAVWTRTQDGLHGRLEMPLAVATVGGSVRAHPGFAAALEMTRAETAGALAVVVAAAGLACNLSALRALAGEGIQKGHMRLHHRKQGDLPQTGAEGRIAALEGR
jgi:hydroxymethylglutaryl-CoA reductase